MVMRAPIGDMPVLRQSDHNAIRTIWPVASGLSVFRYCRIDVLNGVVNNKM